MNTNDSHTLFAFNRWANDRILTGCSQLSPSELTRDLRSSHRSVRGTLVHTLWSEWIWLRRWLGESPKVHFEGDNFPSLDAIEARWPALDEEYRQFLITLTDERLASSFAYENLKNERWEYSYAHAMQHVVNHSSYHRGQVVTLLRQLGKSSPVTGFLVFFDEGGKP